MPVGALALESGPALSPWLVGFCRELQPHFCLGFHSRNRVGLSLSAATLTQLVSQHPVTVLMLSSGQPLPGTGTPH